MRIDTASCSNSSSGLSPVETITNQRLNSGAAFSMYGIERSRPNLSGNLTGCATMISREIAAALTDRLLATAHQEVRLKTGARSPYGEGAIGHEAEAPFRTQGQTPEDPSAFVLMPSVRAAGPT